MAPHSPTQPSRRAVTRGLGWSVPAVVAAATAPMAAASPVDPDARYSFVGTAQAVRDCGTRNGVHITNTQPSGTDPAGFAIVNDPSLAGGWSPVTSVTLTEVLFTVSIRSHLVTTAQNPFTIHSSGENWEFVQRVSERLNGADYFTYSFRFTGPLQRSSSRSAEETSAPPAAWPGSSFDATAARGNGFNCSPNMQGREVRIGYKASGSTGNGQTVSYGPAHQWITMTV